MNLILIVHTGVHLKKEILAINAIKKERTPSYLKPNNYFEISEEIRKNFQELLNLIKMKDNPFKLKVFNNYFEITKKIRDKILQYCRILF